MHKLKWIAGNKESISLGSFPFIVQSKDGFGGPPVSLQLSKAPFQDGSTLIDQLLEPRDLTISMMIIANSNQSLQEHRRRLARLFNPKLGIGTLIWEINGLRYAIDAVSESNSPSFPAGEGAGRNYQQAIIYLKAPNPAWYDPNVNTLTLASYVGGLSFPFKFPIKLGTVGDYLSVDNIGDLNTPVFISFKGPLVNPVLENLTTGEKIIITQSLPAGERLEINTAFGKKTVIRVDANGNKHNAFHWVHPSSKLWQLIPGHNELTYNATEEAGDAAVTISYYHRFVGV